MPSTLKPTRSRTHNYLAGLLTGYAFTLTTMAVGLWMTPFTLRFLSREEFGLFTLGGDTLTWLSLLDFGITAGLRVKAAQLTGTSDQERMSWFASTALCAQSAVVLLVVSIGLGLAFILPRFCHTGPELQHDATRFLVLLVVGSGMSLATQTFSALLVAHQQIHIDNLIRLGLIVIRTALTVFLLVSGWKLISLGVANVAANVVVAGLAILRCRLTLPQVSFRLRFASWDALRSLGGVGIWFSLGALAGVIILDLDRIVAARLISLAAVTTLTLNGRIYVLVGSFLSQITDTARPALGQLVGKGDYQAVLATYRRLFALSSGGAVVTALTIWAANASFVRMWVGPQHYGGWQLDLALALNLVVHSWVLPNRAVLAAALVVRPQTTNRLVEGALNLALSIWLTRHIGLLGIVISTGIAGVLTSCWYLPWLTAKMHHRSFLRFLWDDASRLILMAALLIPVAWWARLYGIHHRGLIGLMLAAATTALSGAGLLYLLTFDQPMRTRVRGAIAWTWTELVASRYSFGQAS